MKSCFYTEDKATLWAFLMKSLQDYTVVIRLNNNGTFVAYVLAILGCHA